VAIMAISITGWYGGLSWKVYLHETPNTNLGGWLISHARSRWRFPSTDGLSWWCWLSRSSKGWRRSIALNLVRSHRKRRT